ncbi:MAG: small basic family protein [Saccharofermentanales bacterium]
MLALLGLIIGLVVGLFLNVDIPQAYSTYVGVGILACFDSIVGALAANIQKKFNMKLFISGLFGNSIIAIALAALGDQLGIQLYLAAVFAFGNRIFINFSIIRRIWLYKFENSRKPFETGTSDTFIKPSDNHDNR